MEHSKKNKGKPARASIITYGIKKAPRKGKKKKKKNQSTIICPNLDGTLTTNTTFWKHSDIVESERTESGLKICEKVVDSLNHGFLMHEMVMLVLPNEVVVIIKNNNP